VSPEKIKREAQKLMKRTEGSGPSGSVPNPPSGRAFPRKTGPFSQRSLGLMRVNDVALGGLEKALNTLTDPVDPTQWKKTAIVVSASLAHLPPEVREILSASEQSISGGHIRIFYASPSNMEDVKQQAREFTQDSDRVVILIHSKSDEHHFGYKVVHLDFENNIHRALSFCILIDALRLAKFGPNSLTSGVLLLTDHQTYVVNEAKLAKLLPQGWATSRRQDQAFKEAA
jgi:hypothetical protein